MFERVVLRKSVEGPAITIGEIAEALLFYQSVHIVLDYSSLVSLIEKIGMRNLLRLSYLDEVKITYIDEVSAVYSENNHNPPRYSINSIRVVGDKETGVLKGKLQLIESLLFRQGYNKKEAKILAKQFKDNVRYQSYSNDHFIKNGLITSSARDLDDNEYVMSSSKLIAQKMLEGEKLPDDFFFRVYPAQQSHGMFEVSTNLDFDLITRIQRQKNESAGAYTPASLLIELVDASMSLVFAGHYGGDFYTSQTESSIIQKRQEYLLQRFQKDRSSLSQFNNIILNDCPSLAAVINQGERTFDEFMELLNSAKRFKRWLKGKSPDESLITAYLQDITAKSWINSIKGQTLRYAFSGSIGAINPFAGAIVGAIDTFFADKLMGGWKPNHFITKSMKPFVDPYDDK